MLGWFRAGPKAEPAPPVTSGAAVVTTRAKEAIGGTVAEPAPAPPAALEPEPHAQPTPHDAVLADVDARLQQLDEILRPSRRRNTLETATGSDDGTSQFQSLVGDTPASSRGVSVPGEPFFDPSTGVPLGALLPPEPDKEHAHDAMWARLARIRELQHEIARMHMGLEDTAAADDLAGDDADDDDPFEVPPGAAPQSPADARRREVQFKRLAEHFKGRKDAIDELMGKLHLLADEAKAFHAMPAPSIRFPGPASRASTGNHSEQSYGAPLPGAYSRGAPSSARAGQSTVYASPHAFMHDSPSSTQASFSPVTSPASGY